MSFHPLPQVPDIFHEHHYLDYRSLLDGVKKIKGGDVSEETSEDFERYSIVINNLLSTIQAAFGVSSGQLADILHVQRQEIFAWTRKESIPLETAEKRLQQVAGFAEKWNSLSNLPADDAMFEAGEDNRSLFQLLKSDVLDDEVICRQIGVAVEKTKSHFEELKKSSFHSFNLRVSEFDLLRVSAYRDPEGQ